MSPKKKTGDRSVMTECLVIGRVSCYKTLMQGGYKLTFNTNNYVEIRSTAGGGGGILRIEAFR